MGSGGNDSVDRAVRHAQRSPLDVDDHGVPVGSAEFDPKGWGGGLEIGLEELFGMVKVFGENQTETGLADDLVGSRFQQVADQRVGLSDPGS